MAFDVLIADEAFRDLDAISGFIRTNSSIDQGRKWFDSITANILSLREMPSRCSICPESEEMGQKSVFFFTDPRTERTKSISPFATTRPGTGPCEFFISGTGPGMR